MAKRAAQIYFADLSSLSVLTREGEVELARRIEAGEREILRTILCSCLPVRDLLLCRAKGKARISEQAQTREVIEIVEQARKAIFDLTAYKARTGQCSSAHPDGPACQGRDNAALLDPVRTAVFQLLPHKAQTRRLVSHLEGVVRIAERALKTVRACEDAAGMPSSGIETTLWQMRSAEPVRRHLEHRLGLGYMELCRLHEEILDAREVIGDVQSKMGMPAEKLMGLWERIERGQNMSCGARNDLIKANLRLVVSIARRYLNQGFGFLDLIQEGNLGLVKAVDRYDHRRGYRFSTYAIWWIWQSIRQSLADKASAIRIPSDQAKARRKIERIRTRLKHETGRDPDPDQIAGSGKLSVSAVHRVLISVPDPISLEAPVGGEDDRAVGELVADRESVLPEDATVERQLKERTRKLLGRLNLKEQRLIRMRFGIGLARDYTLKEIGDRFGVTRERIRQIESTVLAKLRRASDSLVLKSFIE